MINEARGVDNAVVYRRKHYLHKLDRLLPNAAAF